MFDFTNREHVQDEKQGGQSPQNVQHLPLSEQSGAFDMMMVSQAQHWLLTAGSERIPIPEGDPYQFTFNTLQMPKLPQWPRPTRVSVMRTIGRDTPADGFTTARIKISENANSVDRNGKDTRHHIIINNKRQNEQEDAKSVSHKRTKILGQEQEPTPRSKHIYTGISASELNRIIARGQAYLTGQKKPSEEEEAHLSRLTTLSPPPAPPPPPPSPPPRYPSVRRQLFPPSIWAWRPHYAEPLLGRKVLKPERPGELRMVSKETRWRYAIIASLPEHVQSATYQYVLRGRCLGPEQHLGATQVLQIYARNWERAEYFRHVAEMERAELKRAEPGCAKAERAKMKVMASANLRGAIAVLEECEKWLRERSIPFVAKNYRDRPTPWYRRWIEVMERWVGIDPEKVEIKEIDGDRDIVMDADRPRVAYRWESERQAMLVRLLKRRAKLFVKRAVKPEQAVECPKGGKVIGLSARH